MNRFFNPHMRCHVLHKDSPLYICFHQALAADYLNIAVIPDKIQDGCYQ